MKSRSLLSAPQRDGGKYLWFNLLFGFRFMHLNAIFFPLSHHQHKQWMTTNGLMCFWLRDDNAAQGYKWHCKERLDEWECSREALGVQDAQLQMLPGLPHPGRNHPAVPSSLVCMRFVWRPMNGNHLGQIKMAWGHFPSHVALVILIISGRRVIFKGHDIYSYRHLDMFPLNRDRLHSVSMFI